MPDVRGLGAIRHLDIVIVLCDDLDRMTAFYRDVFGLAVEEDTPGAYVGFRLGGLVLAFRPRGRAYDGPALPEASAAIQLSFCVPPEDVDLAYAALVAKGVDVIERPTNQDWPHRTLFFRDPEHNILEIYADIHPREAAPAPSGVHGLG